MGWDGVPLMVEGGAKHNAALVRKLVYAALGGNDGIIRGTDLEVRELAVPGTKVRVFPGVAGIRNIANNAKNELYLGSLFSEDQVDIVATTASGPRSDMICARVENPYISGEPYPDPTDPAVGPYIKTFVVSNVSSSAVVPPIGAGNAVLPLARIDIPASTGTILQSYVADLRYMANVLQESAKLLLPVPGQHTMPTSQNTYITWPSPPMNTQTVRIPAWATKAIIDGTVCVVNCAPGNAMGDIRAGIGALRTGAMRYDYDTPTGQADRQNLKFGGSLAIPAAMRGTVQTFLTEARSFTVASGATAPIYAEVYSTVIADIRFEAAVASNV